MLLISGEEHAVKIWEHEKKNGLENGIQIALNILGKEAVHHTSGHVKAEEEKTQDLKSTKELQAPERCWEIEK